MELALLKTTCSTRTFRCSKIASTTWTDPWTCIRYKQPSRTITPSNSHHLTSGTIKEFWDITGQACCQINKRQLTVRPTTSSITCSTKTRQAPWTLKSHRVNKVSLATKCIKVAFTCKQFKQVNSRRIIVFNFHMHQELREHQAANKMQNRLGTILKASTMPCPTATWKTKIDICRFSNSNRTEMEVDLVDNRNSSLWAQLPTWATFKTSLASVDKTLTWIPWIFSSKRSWSISHPLLALLVISLVQLEAQEMVLTITFTELLDQPTTCNHLISQTWLVA